MVELRTLRASSGQKHVRGICFVVSTFWGLWLLIFEPVYHEGAYCFPTSVYSWRP